MLVDKAAEMRYSFNLVATLRVAAEEKIFDGWTFFVTKSCVPNPEQIKEMVSGCNAKVNNKPKGQVFYISPPSLHSLTKDIEL